MPEAEFESLPRNGVDEVMRTPLLRNECRNQKIQGAAASGSPGSGFVSRPRLSIGPFSR